MSHIKKLVLENYGPFRGEHVLDLASSGVDVFAVTARWEGDESRSNWGGKSYFVHAIALALFDEYPSSSADGWISDGEDEGRVLLEFSDDEEVTVERRRTRMRPTQLRVGTAGEMASQEHAQDRLERYLGLDAKDFFATSFIRQKQVNRFVVARPEQRLAIVAEWLGLDKLREGRKAAAQKFVAARRAVEACRVEEPDDLFRRFERDVAPALSREGLREVAVLVCSTARSELELASAQLFDTKKALDAERVEVERRTRLRAAAEELGRLGTQGKDLKNRLAEIPVVLDEQLEEAESRHAELLGKSREARTAVESAVKLAQGQFEGRCPVNGRDCPVAAEIRGDLVRNRAAHEEAKKALRVVSLGLSEVEEIAARLRAADKKRTRLDDELRSVAERARVLKGAAQEARQLGDDSREGASIRDAYEAVLGRLEAARGRLASAERWLADWDAYERRVEGSREKLVAARAALAVAADAVEVFARAEREIGQAALGDIEAMANRLLANAGIDLSVRMSWGRETKELEPTCHRCGWQYPRGRGTKECGDCGAKRMPKIEERLDLVASARSDGAAEDIAGLVVQLAASAWLRAERGIRLGVVVLDEVTASLDASNRRAIGRVLAQMIRDAGFEQGFVISHAADVAEALPGRIEIVANKHGSRVAVL